MSSNFGTGELLDRSSPMAYVIRQEQLAKERQIATQTQLILRDQYEHCVRQEGVNQFINCKDIRNKYLKMQQDIQGGMLLPPDDERRTIAKKPLPEFGDEAKARFGIN